MVSVSTLLMHFCQATVHTCQEYNCRVPLREASLILQYSLGIWLCICHAVKLLNVIIAVGISITSLLRGTIII